jgi:hypothetical protein
MRCYPAHVLDNSSPRICDTVVLPFPSVRRNPSDAGAVSMPEQFTVRRPLVRAARARAMVKEPPEREVPG